MTDKTLSS